MERAEFLLKVRALRNEGKSIRAIASELGVHRNRVHRALRAPIEEAAHAPECGLDYFPLIGREYEIRRLTSALEGTDAGHGRRLIDLFSGIAEYA